MQFLLSGLAIGGVSLVAFLFSAYIGQEGVAFILLVTLSVIGMFFDIVPVLVAAVLSALIWDYFFLLPRFNFRVGNTEDKIMLSMYFIIALVSGVLTFKIRQHEMIARTQQEQEKTLVLYDAVLNSLSHEFRTPIAAIIGASDNLIADQPLLSPSDRKDLLSEISKAAIRLNQQVENLLDMSRLESGIIAVKKDWCDISELIYTVTLRLENELKHFELKVDTANNLPLFMLDYGLIEQVLFNLLQNATRYTPEGSSIRISANVTDPGLQLIVTDDGHGFPQGSMQKVFEKFYRLESSGTGGIGLGLSIVKGFVESHRGTVILENQSPRGAKFIIEIPTDKYYA